MTGDGGQVNNQPLRSTQLNRVSQLFKIILFYLKAVKQFFFEILNVSLLSCETLALLRNVVNDGPVVSFYINSP